jgi:hypothetical protein
MRSLEKMPREERHEKPNKLRMKRNKPRRFLDDQLHPLVIYCPERLAQRRTGSQKYHS